VQRMQGVLAVLAVSVLPAALSVAQEAQPWAAPGTETGETMAGPDGGTYVWVPAGEFMMGSDDHFDEAEKLHEVRITSGFWLSRCEVTNEQYARFLNAYGKNQDAEGHQLLNIEDDHCGITREGDQYLPKQAQASHPVVDVNWYGARAYCDFYHLRLPTEAQWEYAARGPDAPRYPWGDEWDVSKCCNVDNNSWPWPRMMPVGSIPKGASWCGAVDMAGNVWEWCADWTGAYAGLPRDDPPGPEEGEMRVLRGGAYMMSDKYCRCAARHCNDPQRALDSQGFRACTTP
jgi:formylglycine-generating enzyme required for sulfatase activity